MHRDVKTENMLLDVHRNLKIADFGVARVEAQNPKDMTGETGTLGYMAPEVVTRPNISSGFPFQIFIVTVFLNNKLGPQFVPLMLFLFFFFFFLF